MDLDRLLELAPSEILQHNEKPTGDELRRKQQIYYEDIQEGMRLPRYIYSLDPVHLFRWSAAIEDWDRIHYDLDFAVNHEKLPNIVVQLSWKQSMMPQYLKDWALPGGWLWKASFEHRAILVPGEVLIVWGRVAGKYERGGMGFVELETGMINQGGLESMPGKATVVLPILEGRPIPYPFVPPIL